ncbi:hypothetical protein GCM10027592_03590 [Spirosoma flavus]
MHSTYSYNGNYLIQMPLSVQLINAAGHGQLIVGLILSKQLVNDAPGLAIAQKLSNHKPLDPS